MKRAFAILGVLILTVPPAGSARAQAPFRRAWSRDGWIVGGCVLAGTGAAIAERSLEPIPPDEIDRLVREDVNRFDRPAIDRYSERISDASYLLAGAAVAAPLALLLYPDVRQDWRTFSLMYAETAALAAIIPALAKGAVGRYRPYAYNTDVPMDTRAAAEAKASFFSRHASLSFASAVFLSTVYDAYRPRSRARPYIWCGSLVAAAAVGVMRVESGDHFPTDVIVGAAVGCVVGYAVPRMHRADQTRLSLMPACRGPQLGVAVELRM
jgi:membrane-associated phospholipid phosphatase